MCPVIFISGKAGNPYFNYVIILYYSSTFKNVFYNYSAIIK